ncbi:MAG TPA: ferredoxin [Thermoleophilaceae bacterium]|jgi:ferredoxin
MRAVVDLNVCQGYANCVIEASQIFDIDEDTDKAVVLVDAVPDEALDDVRRAVAACPVSAIALEE